MPSSASTRSEAAPGRSRAAAMPAEERRAALVAATLPLLLAHGSGVTTRQIAEAAGVAEGTIFRVFPDKDALIQAAVETAFDPAPTVQALHEVDLALPLEDRLVAAVAILQERVTRIWQVMTSAGMHRPPDTHTAEARRNPPEMAALAALFAPDAARLRRDPLAAAHLLRGLTFACSHPALTAERPQPATEIVSLLLDGIRAMPDDAATTSHATSHTTPSIASSEKTC